MDVRVQEQVAFYLTGRKPGAGLEGVDDLALLPALFAGYRDLTRLRYDYPVVLVENAPADRSCVQSLSSIVDGLVKEASTDAGDDRLARHLIRLELEIRATVAAGRLGWLSTLWDEAAERLTANGDESVADSLRRARAALTVDGQVIDCDRTMPTRVVHNVWSRAEADRAERTYARIARMILNLSDILQADFSRSVAGRSPENLRASIGAPHADLFDFDAMSRLLNRASPTWTLPATRRQRIERQLDVLRSQRFFAAPATTDSQVQPFSFVFTDCASALTAYRERIADAVELIKAMEIASLELESSYDETIHDSLFADFGVDGLEPEDGAFFPTYLVNVDATRLLADEYDAFLEILTAGLPMKILVRTDDILDGAPSFGDAHLTVGARSRQLASTVIGLNDVFLLQVSASHLLRFRERFLTGMSTSGPAVFSVYSGGGGSAEHIPPYLLAAAAMESRAFPAFTYDPNVGDTWADRFSLDVNPQVELDWPVHHFSFEEKNHQRIEVDVPFTLADFVACDHRFARHFVPVPRSDWNGNQTPVTDILSRTTRGVAEHVPYLLTVDGENELHRVIVDDRVIGAMRRTRESWHSWQELGGVHNSHAERLLARERETLEEIRTRAAQAVATQPITPAVTTTTDPGPAPAVEADAPSPDEAYVETPRCTTCNECIQINNKMFAYDENKQCHIVDINAGTYRDLVEAAENCQVAIIHPGRPRNPNEPGLEELLKRAEPFL